MTKKKQLKIRDKKITCQRLISAVGSILSKKGFKAIGVNAVAREAGVDKVLIYRYFGDLEGLITAFGKKGDFWPQALELAGGDLKHFSQMPLEERLSQFGYNYFKALKNRPVTRAVMAWEMIEPNGLTKELEQIREESIMEFFKMFFTRDEINFDLQAVMMLIGAGISYLAIRSRYIDFYGGIELNSDKGWKRMEKAFKDIIQGILTNR